MLAVTFALAAQSELGTGKLIRTGIGPCGVGIVGGSDIWARGAMASSVVRYFGIV